jgi:signal transduction histidine kinase
MELRNIDLVRQLSPKPLVIYGNDNRLHQCFLNLIFNAIEAMPDGGQLRIVSELERKNKRAQINIQDTGYGIQKENLSHIFDPFFTTKGEGKGTGLGLSIVYGVTKNHKGNISIDSAVGKGTSFILTFPTV